MHSKRRSVFGGVAVCVAAALAIPVAAGAAGSLAERAQIRGVPASLSALRLPQVIRSERPDRSVLHASLANASGRPQVIVRLRSAAAMAQVAVATPTERRSFKSAVQGQQSGFVSRCQSHDPQLRVLGKTQLVLNAVFLEVDAAALSAIALDPDVIRIAPVANYEMFLSETVPLIGGSAMHAAGVDGSGVRVAILDSGIDYTHANLGGPGTAAAYAAATADTASRDGLFPTAKVVDGFDFVGPVWPNGPLAMDDDPIDLDGHGTHVGDIIGGVGGVAPGASLISAKVCSSVSSSCSGVALLLAMEFAVDPNGDGDTEDRVDVINMSLGSNYGQAFDDDLSAAVDNATALGVLTVASAGNGSDKPYVTGTPAAAPTALSVAQTQVPSAFLPFMTILEPVAEAGDRDAVHQPWSATLTSIVEGSVTYGDGNGGNLNGCAPFGVPLSGIVMVDRGACFFTTKIINIEQAGGSLGIIGLVAPGAPFPGGAGEQFPFTISGFMISQVDANVLRSGAAVVRFDPANGLALAESMVGSSSRGPDNDANRIKPEIGAPGASLSAEVGTGTGVTPFGGTSGAAPMVTGSAALLVQAFPSRSALEIKAVLMNTAETGIANTVPGDLAPISRIGGGEVRVDRAAASESAAWDAKQPTGGLGFGFVDAADAVTVLKKKLRIRNYSEHTIEYTLEPTFRFADDAASGAVTISSKKMTVKVKKGKEKKLPVTLTIHGNLLGNNPMSSGGDGANPATLTAAEYDGYLNLIPRIKEKDKKKKDGDDNGGASPVLETIHVPWHVIPRKAARVEPMRTVLDFTTGSDLVPLTNTGVGDAQMDSYSLIALSPDQPRGGKGANAPTPDIRAVGVTTFIVSPGFCESEFLWVFAVNTWERQSSLVPVSHQIALDTDQDGIDDYVLLNRDLSFDGVDDGRQVSWVFELATGTITAFFFAEHATNTANTALIMCGEQAGLTAADILTRNIDVSVVTQDFYFGGPGDSVDGITVTPFGERYFGGAADMPGGATGALSATDFGLFPGNTDELGMLVFTNGDRGAGAHGGATAKSEALLFTVPGVVVPQPIDDDDDDGKGHDD